MSNKKQCEKLIEQYKKAIGKNKADIETTNSHQALFGLGFASVEKHIKWKDKIKDCFESLSYDDLMSFTDAKHDSDIQKWARDVIRTKERCRKGKSSWFYQSLMPKYSEASLYLMSLTFVLLLIFDRTFRVESMIAWYGGFVFIGGFFLSIYHAFSSREKTRLGRLAMLWFAIIVSGVVGGYGFVYGVTKIKTFSAIFFPLLNLINTFLMFLLTRLGGIGYERVSSGQTRRVEIAISSILLFSIFALSHFFWGNFWPTTFSMCLVYATNINSVIKKLFFTKN